MAKEENIEEEYDTYEIPRLSQDELERIVDRQRKVIMKQQETINLLIDDSRRDFF